jgi:hypothetical protein
MANGMLQHKGAQTKNSALQTSPQKQNQERKLMSVAFCIVPSSKTKAPVSSF